MNHLSILQQTSLATYTILLLSIQPIHAQEENINSAAKGLSIALETERRDSGWHDSQSQSTMILLNKHGDKRRRELTSRALEVAGDGDKRLVIFEYPPDVRGTTFLTFTHKNKDDDQWIYIPSLQRIKRIAVSSKSNSFMGTEFSYEDIAGQEVEKFTYRWIKDESYEGRACFVVESTPVDLKNSGYVKRISWIDKRDYLAHKIIYINRKGNHYKTLFLTGYKKHLNAFWRPSMMEMVNLQNGRSTQIRWYNYQFQTGLNKADFTQRALRH